MPKGMGGSLYMSKLENDGVFFSMGGMTSPNMSKLKSDNPAGKLSRGSPNLGTTAGGPKEF